MWIQSIYTKDGREIKEIKQSGEYYIIEKENNKIVNKKKIITIE